MVHKFMPVGCAIAYVYSGVIKGPYLKDNVKWGQISTTLPCIIKYALFQQNITAVPYLPDPSPFGATHTLKPLNVITQMQTTICDYKKFIKYDIRVLLEKYIRKDLSSI